MPHSLPPIGLYRRIAVGLLVSVGVVFLAILYVSMVHAEVTVTLKKQKFPFTYSFVVAQKESGERQGELGSARIAGALKRVERMSRREIAANTLRFEQGKAQGVVTIVNRYSRPQPLVATTRLLSKEGVLFRTIKRVDVPAGGSIDVPVVADEQGEKGDIGPTTFTIPGLWVGLQDKITGSSKQPTSGGKRRVVDLSEEKQRSIELEEAQLQRKNILEELGGTSDGSVTIALVEKTRSTTEPTGDSGIRLDVATTIILATFNPDPLEQPLKSTVSSVLPREHMFGGVDRGEPFEYSLKSIDAAAKEAIVSIKAVAWGVIAADRLPLSKEQLAGLGRADISAIERNFDEIERISVRFSPFWMRTIPKRADRIDLNVISPTE